MKKLLALVLTVALLCAVVPFAVSAAGTTYSGTCGDNLTWTVDPEAGTLTISGTGEMDDYNKVYPPWFVSEEEGAIPAWYAAYGDVVRSVVVEDGVTTIGKWAFAQMGALETATIADSVTAIGELAFYECSALTGIRLPAGLTVLEEKTFYRCAALPAIHIPDSVTAIRSNVFRSCTALSAVTGGNGLTIVGESAFAGCTALTSILLPGTLREFGAFAYMGCTGLTELEFPAQQPLIMGYGVFMNCTNLVRVTVGDVGIGTFYNCTGLQTLVVRDGVTEIAPGAFGYCEALCDITFPEGLTAIGEASFTFCGSIETIYYGGTEEAWNAVTVGEHNTGLKTGVLSFGRVAAEENGAAVEWGAGEAPEDASLQVTREEPSGEILSGLGDYDTGNAVSYDLALTAGTEGDPVALTEPVTVSLAVPESMDKARVRVLFVKEDGSTQDVNAVYENGKMTFKTAELGTFVLVENTFLWGDANGDGKVNSQDIIRLKNYLANYNYETGSSTYTVSAGADANGDGKINSQDIIRLKNYLANYNYETESSTYVLGPAA